MIEQSIDRDYAPDIYNCGVFSSLEVGLEYLKLRYQNFTFYVHDNGSDDGAVATAHPFENGEHDIIDFIYLHPFDIDVKVRKVEQVL